MLIKSNVYASITGSISSGTANPLTITVTSGQGVRFSDIPASSGKWFMAALVDEGPNKVEIVHCYTHTSGSPDTFVVLRARDGTTAKDWAPGDNFIQISDTESGWGDTLDQFAIRGLCTGVGTNTVTTSLPSGYQQLIDGMRLRVKAAAANTGAMTLAVTFDHSSFGGTTYAIAAKAIVKGANAALTAGDVPNAGYHMDLVYRSSTDDYLLLNPYVGPAAIVAGATNVSLLNTIYVTLGMSPYTYNKTVNNPSFVEVEAVGGAGGGGGVSSANATKAAGGGSGGQYQKKRISAASLSTTTTVTIGAGGSGGSTSGGTGGNGADTTFGSLVTAKGGLGGVGSVGNGGAGGASNTGGLGDFTINGQPGQEGGDGGGSGAGGNSSFGFGGPGKNLSGDGVAGTGYGAGGSGACDLGSIGRTGAVGTAGLCIIREYK